MPKSKTRDEKILQGIAASPGLAHGPAFLFFQKEIEVPVYGVDKSSHEKEVSRFKESISKTKAQISKIRKTVSETLGEAEAQIFDAHLLVLEDKAIIKETIKELKESSFNIDYCFYAVSRRYMDAFGNIDDEYIKERASDIRDVSKRVLSNLLGQNPTKLMKFSEKKVIVSDDLSPSNTAEFQKNVILAIAMNKGSRTSHAVIMARSLQIPAVVGLHNVTDAIANDDYVIVDGFDGVVIINPTKETLDRYGQIKREHQNIQEIFESVNKLPAETKDKKSFSLMANIEAGQDIQRLVDIGANGVGLFRTETVFLMRDKIATEEEQFDVYKKVVEGIAPAPITIRTLDLGGDKKLSSFFISDKEANPFMGFRAIRFCLEHKDLFKDQLRAILRASVYGKANLMYPMITSPSELIQANEILEEAKRELKEKGVSFDAKMEVGCMIETPSAALIADLLAEHCSFFSIGTNDLIQYTLAVDRVNDRIAHLYQPNHPSVVRMLKLIVDAAKEKKIKVSVCGEMAGDPLYVPLLIGLGVDSLSVSPGVLPEIKYVIRSMNTVDATEMAKEVIKQKDAASILKILRDFYVSHVGKTMK